MTRHFDARRLNVQAFAEAAETLSDSTLLQNMERLAPESAAPDTKTLITWKLAGQIRPGASGQPDVWLHIQADVAMALTCQRCITAVTTPVTVNQWYRFVATEDVAMAEDDAAEEDLLVMAPHLIRFNVYFRASV